MTEAACPFCSADVSGLVKRCAHGVSGRGLSRLTVVTLVAAGLEVTNCGSDEPVYGTWGYGIYDSGITNSSGGSRAQTGGYANCLPAFGPCPAGGASTTGGARATGGQGGGAGDASSTEAATEAGRSDSATDARDTNVSSDAAPDATDASIGDANSPSDAGAKDQSAG